MFIFDLNKFEKLIIWIRSECSNTFSSNLAFKVEIVKYYIIPFYFIYDLFLIVYQKIIKLKLASLIK